MTLSHYLIEQEIGRGGMGVVYRATDTRLGRPVAIKVLPVETTGDRERNRRFVHEARSASALNHPAIVTIHEIDEHEGTTFIAMELVDGAPLDRVLATGRLSLETALDYATQIASGLAAAHVAGLVHRDLKPANVMITRDGRAKILDFGLAKLIERGPHQPTITGMHTGTGVIVGTAAYMSPEQAQGRPVTARSDIFSFGVLLYEMLAGRRPFVSDSDVGLLVAIASGEPPSLLGLRPDIDPAIETIVRRCLEKKPDARYADAGELHAALTKACEARRPRAVEASPRRRVMMGGIAVALLAIASVGVWQVVQARRAQKARAETIPEIERLASEGGGVHALRLARDAERIVPDDVARLKAKWYRFGLDTEPSGADVTMTNYAAADGPWESIGRTPIKELPVPAGFYRVRIAKEGYLPMEVAAPFLGRRGLKLAPREGSPPGMVFVAGAGDIPDRVTVPLPDFWIDKYEVSNKEYKAFVDAGGYSDPKYWSEPFVDGTRVLPFAEAMTRFRDATGRPGPATWDIGMYPDGQEDHPVGGISWFEAAAYAVFAGKSLPTRFHWQLAARGPSDLFSDIVRLSNFDGRGATKRGERAGLSVNGAYDMAGNVKEWVRNGVEGSPHRMILGGGWNEPAYRFGDPDASDPWQRLPTYGMRLVKNSGPVGEAALAAFTAARDPKTIVPVSAQELQIYKGLYQYDRTPLNARVEGVDDTAAGWRKETITFDAPYGTERIRAYLFLPRHVQPPYQIVLLAPSGYALWSPSSAHLDYPQFEFILRSGRALLYPVLHGTFERRTGATSGPNQFRDTTVQQVKDLLRSVEYIATRSDLDIRKLGYFSVSMFAYLAPIPLALEPRFKVAVLVSGGLRTYRIQEILPANFEPEVKTPLILINGRDDFSAPPAARERFMELLGTPPEHRRLEILEGGHYPNDRRGLVRYSLEWFDKYLGPVR